jgi:glycogen synthase
VAVKLAFITYETPFAPCGGIASVMDRLPYHIKEVSKLPTIVITPFHYNIEKTSALKMCSIGEVSVPYNGGQIPVEVYQHDDKISWYFLRAKDPRFFAGKNHPYDVGQDRLIRDSLFFGVAVARALQVIQAGTYWNLLMQDWEAATTALALASRGKGCRLFLMLHNSYDSGAISDNLLRGMGINPGECSGGSPMSSVLERALPLTEWPVLTVSNQYALDLTEDILMAEIMASHLRDRLKPRLIGVNNGPFINPNVSDDLIADAARGNFDPLEKWKNAKRDDFVQAVEKFRPSRQKPLWGNQEQFKADELPWFVMAGRDDPRQRGYDVAAGAVYDFLDQGGKARFLFFPIPGEEGLTGLDFLKKLSESFPGSVLVFPFMFREGFMVALQGAAYGFMPSLYEPFGMANEFYLNGTVGIGRATGGLLQQIVPLREASSFSQAVKERAAHWHEETAHPTGILYRERDNFPSAIENWREINAAKYKTSKKKWNRLQQRQMFPLFNLIADELLLSIKDGVRVYNEQRDLYYKMLTEGIAYIQSHFSWKQAAEEYLATIFSWEHSASNYLRNREAQNHQSNDQ